LDSPHFSASNTQSYVNSLRSLEGVAAHMLQQMFLHEVVYVVQALSTLKGSALPTEKVRELCNPKPNLDSKGSPKLKGSIRYLRAARVHPEKFNRAARTCWACADANFPVDNKGFNSSTL
jgi:hypothetical protein